MLVFTVLSRTPELAKMAERLGIIDGQPFLIGEDGTFDRDVNAFLRSLVDPSRPGRNTWRTYAYHLARFLCWLAQQEIAWRAVDCSVLRLYYTQRRFSQKRPVSARTWNNIAAALTRFYEWAAMTGEIAKSPVAYRDIRAGRMTAAPGTQRVRSAIMESVSARPVRYLPLKVYLAQFRPAFSDTRTSERDRAFADLQISTGMRINEANSLLLGDLPDAVEGVVIDDPRSQYIFEYLKAALNAIDKGVKLRGLSYWSATDNWEWTSGFTIQFGLIRVDIPSQKRTVKKSLSLPDAVEGVVIDDPRSQYIFEYLKAALNAIDKGVKLRGLSYWSATDNWEWTSGFTIQFGLIRVDIPSQKRTVKKSLSYYADCIRHNAVLEP
ncbi:family 1 glycosylhydrolase [Pantoea sp. Bo_13]|nr:family 1 glycosylhydrolase [Pantoea sp. Bo_13]